MAYTTTLTMNTVFGDQRVQGYTITADAASATIATGLRNLTNVIVTAGSATSSGYRVRLNATAAGTAAVGSIGLSGLTSGDVLYVMAYGS